MLTISETPVTDILTHTSYLKTNAVDLLPTRRTIEAHGLLRESVIHLHRLRTNSPRSVLLRVRHIAVDYRRDFEATDRGIVPGTRIIAKAASVKSARASGLDVLLSDKLFVFPHSACWIQLPDDLCQNCRILLHLNTGAYETHRRFPCLQNLTYGQTLDGGLQDYIRVPRPQQLLLKIPSQVSLHDTCFLLDIALPLYSFCKDHLLRMLSREPLARVLVILNDSAREANDCLLVINHLDLEHLLITFVDMNKLRMNPKGYAKDYHHVLVFAPGPEAIEAAFALSINTKLESTKLRYSIALFGENADFKLTRLPEDKTVYRVKLSYKDRFLMEELLATLLTFSGAERKTKPLRSMSLGTLSSSESEQASDEITKKRLRFKKEAEIVVPRSSKTHISWLHCDDDFKLCTEEENEYSPMKCHLTSEINRLIKANCQTRRVFYTNRPVGQTKMNAFIFAGGDVA